MKARKITKIYVHYLKSSDLEYGKYHFVLNDGIMSNTMAIYQNSSIDNDAEALHFGCVNYTDLPQRVTALVDLIASTDAKIIEVSEDVSEEISEEIKPKKKKK